MSAIPIVALDVPRLTDALDLVDRLGEDCGFFKVGSELFTAAGPGAVQALRERGRRVFLDLKYHDIPKTVHSAATSAAALGVSLITVHATGGEEMLSAAVDGAGSGCGVLAVTVLTSLDGEAVAGAWGRGPLDVGAEVVRLARVALGAGAHGVVCAGTDLSAVRSSVGERLSVLVPGIRFADGDRHDQRRVMTPFEAARLGASYLVLGRAITGAADPAAAMRRVNDDVRRASQGESSAECGASAAAS